MCKEGFSQNLNNTPSMPFRASSGISSVRRTDCPVSIGLFYSSMLLLGCSKLARVEEDIVIAFTEYGSEDNTRLTVQLNRAYDVCFNVMSVFCCV